MLFRPVYTKQLLILSALSAFLYFVYIMSANNNDLYYSFPRKISAMVFYTYFSLIFLLYFFYRFKVFIEIADNIVISYPFSWGKKPYSINQENVKSVIYDDTRDFFLFETNDGFLDIDCKAWNFVRGVKKDNLKNAINSKVKEWGIKKNKADFFDVEKYKQRFLYNHVYLVFFIALAIILQAITFEYNCYILPSVQMLNKIVITLSTVIAIMTLLFYWYREKDGRIFESSYFSILALPFIFSLCCAYAIPKYTVFKGKTKEYVYTLISSNENEQVWQSQGMDDLQIKHKYNYDYRDEKIGTQRTVIIYQGWTDIKVIKESTVNSFFQK